MQYLLLIAWLACTSPLSDGKRILGRDDASENSTGIAPAQTIEVPIDHFNDSTNLGTYKNRFWVNSTFYQPGGPVVVYDPGESGVYGNEVASRFGANNPQMSIVERYHGLALIWEHRFYGESLPFPVDNNTGFAIRGREAYDYLTTEQAMEDVVYFANHFQPQGLKESWQQLHPSNTPWIWMGGSYPGQRAVFLRIRNPEVIFASWASSAPVETMIAMPTYYDQIFQDMTANCSADLAAASRYLDDTLVNGTQMDGSIVKWVSMLATTGVGQLHDILAASESDLETMASNAGNTSDYYAAVNVIDIMRASAMQTQGFADETLSYCDLIQQYDPETFMKTSSLQETVHALFGPQSNASHVDPSDAGLGAIYGNKAAFAGVIYATALHTQFSSFYNNPRGPRGHPVDSSSWNWQHCAEYSNWMIASNSQFNMLSHLVDVRNSEIAGCGENSTFPFEGVPTTPDVEMSNKYGGWNMQPSNVMFIDGLKDPWHTLSVHSTSTEIGAPNRSSTQEVPACNQPPANNEVFGMMFPDGYHANDLNPGPEADAAFQLFAKALDVWLPCFNASSAQEAGAQRGIAARGLRLPSSMAGLAILASCVFMLV